MLTQGNFFKGHNELHTEGGESRVAENTTRRRVTQGGGTGRCLHQGFFLKGHTVLHAEGGESREAANPAKRRSTQG